jgi:hypothetical protein
MALVASALSSSLASTWLVAEGGSYPSSPAESADHFAGAVATWFAAATAGPFPCTTATARRAQLQGQAAAAFQARDPQLAAAQLALALMAYMTGQVFGPGVASPPTATSAAQAAIGGVFADLDGDLNSRADRIAQGMHTQALSTIVVFPPVVSPPTPVT